MAHLAGLIMGYRYLPDNVKFTVYLFELYQETYPGVFQDRCVQVGRGLGESDSKRTM
jgi:hypothetical protein